MSSVHEEEDLWYFEDTVQQSEYETRISVEISVLSDSHEGGRAVKEKRISVKNVRQRWLQDSDDTELQDPENIFENGKESKKGGNILGECTGQKFADQSCISNGLLSHKFDTWHHSIGTGIDLTWLE